MNFPIMDEMLFFSVLAVAISSDNLVYSAVASACAISASVFNPAALFAVLELF